MKKIYTTKYSKLIITLERGGVKNGRMNENVPARFITSDPFLQYMIEKDARYGSLFRLEKSIPTNEEIREAQNSEAKKKEEKKNVSVTVIESVTDISEAIDYFSTLGKVLTTEKQVKAAMRTMNIEIPNWKQ